MAKSEKQAAHMKKMQGAAARKRAAVVAGEKLVAYWQGRAHTLLNNVVCESLERRQQMTAESRA